MNSSSEVFDDKTMQSVENSVPHGSGASNLFACSSKSHNRPVADHARILDRDAGSVVMKSEPISNDELEPSPVLATVKTVHVKQEIPELPSDSNLPSSKLQEKAADDLSIFDCESLSEYDVSDSDDGNETFDGFCDTETEVAALNSEESNDRDSFEGFSNNILENPVCKSEISETECEAEDVEAVQASAVELQHIESGRYSSDLISASTITETAETPGQDAVGSATLPLLGNSADAVETQLPLPIASDDCSFEGFLDGEENSDKDMNTSKYKSQFLFTRAILPELKNQQGRNEVQLSPKQYTPKKTGVSPKQARSATKSKKETEEYIGPCCQAVGCTVSWLESGLQKCVNVNNGIVVELTEFGKKIAWERKYVAQWILRLRELASNTVEVDEEDLKKIHMVNKRRKAISVTFSGKNLLKLKLAAFDEELFILPSEASASNGKKIGCREICTSTSSKLDNGTSLVLFSKTTGNINVSTQAETKHELNQSSLSRSTNNVPLHTQSHPFSWGNEMLQLPQENTSVLSASFVEDDSDSDHEMVIDETAHSHDETEKPDSLKNRDTNGKSQWVSSPVASNDVVHMKTIKNNTNSLKPLYEMNSEKTSVDISESSKRPVRISHSSPKKTKESIDLLSATKKIDISKSSFGQHIVFASKKGKEDFAGKNVQYPIFEIRDNAIGPFCIRESLDVETLNSPMQKVSVTNGMVIELYIFFKERGATLTSLVYKLHQLMCLPINITLMQSDMAKIQEVVNVELQKKTDYYLEKEFTFSIFQKPVNNASSSRTPSTVCCNIKSSTNGFGNVTNTKQPISDLDRPKIDASSDLAAIKSTKITKIVGKAENLDGLKKSVASAQSLSKAVQQSGDHFSPLKTRSHVSNNQNIDEMNQESTDTDEVVVRDLNLCKGKRGCITRGDIVKLYYNWLQLKNKDKDSVFVIDLLSEVEGLMISRGVDVIRIPVGTLMSSSVKLFEEYQRFRLSSQEDALAYLEDDWLEDIQYLVSISKSRCPATELPVASSKSTKAKGKAVASNDPNSIAMAGQASKCAPRNNQNSVLVRQKESVNISSEDLKRKTPALDVDDRSSKKSKLAHSNEIQVEKSSTGSNQDFMHSPEPIIDMAEFAKLSFSSKIEMVLSCRLSSTFEGPVYEYLVQWRNNEDLKIRNTWIAESDLPSAFIFITNFWEDNPMRILKAAKILKHRNSKMAEPLVEYLVLWNKYNCQSWIREDHLPEQSESVVQSYLSSFEDVDDSAVADPETETDSAVNHSLKESGRKREIISSTNNADELVSSRTVESTGMSVVPKKASHDHEANKLLMNGADRKNKEKQVDHSSVQPWDSLKHHADDSLQTQPSHKLGIREKNDEIENKSESEMVEDDISSNDSSVTEENLGTNMLNEVEPDDLTGSGKEGCGAQDVDTTDKSSSNVNYSTDSNEKSSENLMQNSSDGKADSTNSASTSLALTNDKENSSDSGQIHQSLKKKSLPTVKRRPRDELLTKDEKSNEITYFKKIPLSAVFGEKSKCKSLTEAIIQHVNTNYPSSNPKGIEVKLYDGPIRQKPTPVSKGHILSIYDEWRVARKRSNSDISTESVAALRNRIRALFKSCSYKYDYDDCLLGICYSLYLSRLKLESVTDIVAFNNSDCIKTFKHFKQKHSSVLSNFYAFPNPTSTQDEDNSEVSSTTDFPVSEAQQNLAQKMRVLSQASTDKETLSNSIGKLKQGILEIEESIGNHRNNNSEVKEELGSMKVAVTILEKGLLSNEKDVDKLQTQVDKETALLSLKSSGLKDNDIVDLLKLVNQSLPEEAL